MKFTPKTSVIRNNSARQQYQLQMGSGLNGRGQPKSGNSVAVLNQHSRSNAAGTPKVTSKPF